MGRSSAINEVRLFVPVLFHWLLEVLSWLPADPVLLFIPTPEMTMPREMSIHTSWHEGSPLEIEIGIVLSFLDQQSTETQPELVSQETKMTIKTLHWICLDIPHHELCLGDSP